MQVIFRSVAFIVLFVAWTNFAQAFQETSPASKTDEKVEPTYEEVDYKKIERRLAAEPEYVSEPRYALFLFGSQGTHKMWVVLDKSDASLEYYDVMYCDKNFDGDLTGPDERFTSDFDEDRARAGLGIMLQAGEINVPGEDVTHTKFIVATVNKRNKNKSDGSAWFRMRWNGTDEMSGGYAPARAQTTVWGKSLETAPIFRPNPNGAFSFGLYTWGQDG